MPAMQLTQCTFGPGIAHSLRDFADSDGVQQAIYKIENWREVLEDMIEVSGPKEQPHLMDTLYTLNEVLRELLNRPAPRLTYAQVMRDWEDDPFEPR